MTSKQFPDICRVLFSFQSTFISHTFSCSLKIFIQGKDIVTQLVCINCFLIIEVARGFLAVQWFKTTSTAGAAGLTLAGELKSHMPRGQK